MHSQFQISKAWSGFIFDLTRRTKLIWGTMLFIRGTASPKLLNKKFLGENNETLFRETSLRSKKVYESLRPERNEI